jgi:hypothetical protein
MRFSCYSKGFIYGKSHLKAVPKYIDSVRTGDSQGIKSTYSDAVKTLELTLASNESMDSIKPIPIY